MRDTLSRILAYAKNHLFYSDTSVVSVALGSSGVSDTGAVSGGTPCAISFFLPKIIDRTITSNPTTMITTDWMSIGLKTSAADTFRIFHIL